MATRSELNRFLQTTGLVDRYIGDAYPIVKKVSEYLEQIEFVANIYESGRSRDIVLEYDDVAFQINWGYKGDPINNKLVNFVEAFGSDLATLMSQQSDLIQQLQALENSINYDYIAFQAAVEHVERMESNVEGLEQSVVDKESDINNKWSDVGNWNTNVNNKHGQIVIIKNDIDVKYPAIISAKNSTAQDSLAAKGYKNNAETYANNAYGYWQQSLGFVDEARDWANKTSDTVDGLEYSAKYYAEAADTATQQYLIDTQLVRDWAVKMDGLVNNEDYSSKYYANQSSGYADLAKDWATKTTEVEPGLKSAKSYAEDAENFILSAFNDAIISSNYGWSGDKINSELLTKVDKESGKGLSDNNYTSTEKNKLAGIADNATANSPDDSLLNRANHTGTQTISTISDAESWITGKNYLTSHQDISGKADIASLSLVAISNDYDDLDNKPSIPNSTDVSKGVTAYNWGDHSQEGYLTSESDPTVPAWAKNPSKPSYTAAEVGALENITGLITQGTNVTITGSGTSASPYIINSSGGGEGSYSWGSIGGILSDQLDLKSALDDKANTSSLKDVATSGNYSDLINKPSLGTASDKDVASSGNASSSQVVLGNDTRLNDSRTPLAHTHVSTDIIDSTSIGRSVLTSADAASVRSAIGAGTSNLALGTTSSTAMPGNTVIPSTAADVGALTQAAGDGRYARLSGGADADFTNMPRVGGDSLITAKDLEPYSTYGFKTAPFGSLYADSGKFADPRYAIARNCVGFDAADFWTKPGNPAPVSVGKFIYDNSTFGGSAGALTSTVEDLIIATGRIFNDRRYGVEFNVAEFEQGNDETYSPAATPFGPAGAFMRWGGEYGIFVSDGWGTFVGWLRAIDGPVWFSQSGNIRVNGVPVSQPLIDPTDGWVHLRASNRQLRGYDNETPKNYAALGTKLQVAMPGYFSGIADVGIHTSPLLSKAAVLGVPNGNLGVGQTWVNVLASRAASTTYTNTTGRPIVVQISTTGEVSQAGRTSLKVDGVTVSDMSKVNYQGAGDSSLTAIVPPGSTYRLDPHGGLDIGIWVELR